MPEPLLDSLIARLRSRVAALVEALAGGLVDAGGWRDQMAQALARYHTAAMLAGTGERTLSDGARRLVDLEVARQLEYLDGFAAALRQAGPDGRTAARAALYAESIGGSYWRGRTYGLPLPFWPKDGTTQCIGNCLCAWDIQRLDGDGNHDCYWRVSAAENCQTCTARAARNPYRIRAGVLQL